MTTLALLLVLTAAGLHASWNLCAKKASGGLPFVFVVGIIICTVYVPVVTGYWLWRSPALTAQGVLWMMGSGAIKTGYFLLLQRGYRSGDFSLIYPLARGTGPLLSMVAAIALLGERPTALALAGAAIIITAVFFLADGTRILRENRAHLRTGIGYGLATGVFIAGYTLWDRRGVATLAVPPVLFDAGTALTQLALLTPFALRRRAEVRAVWRDQRRYAFGVALLSPLAYVLVLTALSFTPVSYIAPAREVSIVIGAFLGAKVLKETDGRRRLWAAGAMAVGVIALALG